MRTQRIFNPYAMPRYEEKEEAHRALMRLDAKQQSALRSYVLQVHFGSMSLAEWHKSPHGVSRAVWRKPYRLGGRYYGTEEDGNPLFRDALEKLIACYAAARTAEEERAVAAAGRAYKLAAEEAALVHIQLMRHSEKEEVRLAAANQVADRAGLIKPTKLDVTSGGERVRTYTVLAHPGLWDDDAESGS